MSTEIASDPLVFDVSGMDCGECAKSVERAVCQLPGVAAATVSLGAGLLTVQPGSGETAALVRAIAGAVDRAGYSAALRTPDGARLAAAADWWKDRRLLPALAALVLWAIAFGMHLLGVRERAVDLVYAAAIVTGGYRIARAAAQALRVRSIDMNVLMTISVIGAAALGDWSEGAMVVVLFTIGASLQGVAFARTRHAIRSLLDLSPDEATLVRDGIEMSVAAATLRPGDLVRVRPGERIPADGTVIEGMTAVDQSALTGESLPVEKAAGDSLFAGTVNGGGTVLVRVARPAADSTLARVVHLVEEAQGSKAPSQQLVDRFAAIYTPAVVLGALALALVGAFASGDAATWVYRALVLLVIACPCALVISTPVAIVSAIGAATRQGVLVKGGAALERIGKVAVVAFDKTGTLTRGRPAVTEVIGLNGIAPAEVLGLAAAVEQHSEHPIGRAIVARALHDEVPVAANADFAAQIGRGARAIVDGVPVMVGSERLLSDLGSRLDPATRALRDRLASSGQSTQFVARHANGAWQLLGLIAVADQMRAAAPASVAALRAAGIGHIAMITGDNAAVARAIGAAAGVDEVRADLLPAEKADVVGDLQQRFGPVAMVGDGINDAPALATADVGVAMGAAGSDVALETAELALMRDDLGGLASAIRLSRRTVAIIRQNVTLSLVIKALALLLGVFGFVSLWIAVLADVGTSLIVTLNGLRLAREQADQGTVVVEPASVASEAAAAD